MTLTGEASSTIDRPPNRDDDLRAVIERLGPWQQNLHLPDGARTAPDHPEGDHPAVAWRRIASRLPADLTGWTALDIGCNAGFHSFELARRGARVIGVDHDAHVLTQARWAATVLGLEERVRFEHRSIYQLAQGEGKFDLVLLLDVFQRLRYPLLGLDAAARRVGKRLVLRSTALPTAAPTERTEVDENRPSAPHGELAAADWPHMSFVEHRLDGDPTNWWVPNRAGVEAMLRSAGLEVIERIGTEGEEVHLCRPSSHPEAAWGARELDRVFR